jgi:hypothetical protein
VGYLVGIHRGVLYVYLNLDEVVSTLGCNDLKHKT